MPGGPCDLAELSWPDIPSGSVVFVPLGSFEQHGPHLPMHTDTVIAQAVATSLADRRGALVAPPVRYGASGEHQDFPGTISIGTAVLHQVLLELVRSLSQWAGGTIFVNGHGGNLPALASAVPQLRLEGHDVAWLPCTVPSGDLHAGYVETSLMLHLEPDRVDLARAVVGNRAPLTELMPALRSSQLRTLSPSGVLGDPTGATVAAGHELLEAMTADAVARIRAGRLDSRGCLTDSVKANS